MPIFRDLKKQQHKNVFQNPLFPLEYYATTVRWRV